MAIKVTRLQDVFKDKVKEGVSVPTVWLDMNGVEHEDTQYTHIDSNINTYGNPDHKIDVRYDYSLNYDSLDDLPKDREKVPILQIPGKIVRIGSHVLEVGRVCDTEGDQEYTEEELDYLFRGATNLRMAFACFYNNKKVCHIPNTIFKNCKKLENVTKCFDESGLEEIPAGLFDNCPNLQSARLCFSSTEIREIPENLFANNPKVITFESCFSYCKNLRSIPKTLFSHTEDIPNMARCFEDCTSLTEIPDGLFDFATCYNKWQRYANFLMCFNSCVNIQNVPLGLFKNISGTTTFRGCLGGTKFSKNGDDVDWSDYFSSDALRYVEGIRESPFTQY